MKTFKISLFTAALMIATLASCKNTSEKKQIKEMAMEQPAVEEKPVEQKIFPITFDGLIGSYLAIKDALVADNNTAAADEAKQFFSILEKLELSELEEAEQAILKTSAPSMKQHADEMIQGDMVKQREHLELLTDDMIAMVAVTGSSKTLYQQFCPMYQGNVGGIWLSESKEIKNPLFGSKMLKCGVVQAEFN